MVFDGQVVAGRYVNSSVDINRRGELVVHLGVPGTRVSFKSRKLDAAEIAEWEEASPQERGGVIGVAGSVGQAVAGAALPGFLGKAASAAVGAGLEAANRQRFVRVTWSEGDKSLIRLPEKMFTHLILTAETRRVISADVPGPSSLEESETAGPSQGLVTQLLEPTSEVINHVADLIKNRRSKQDESQGLARLDVVDEIGKLAELRDRGVLSEEEFSEKKTALLARL
jgi:hypothetical protein